MSVDDTGQFNQKVTRSEDSVQRKQHGKTAGE